MPVVPHVRRHQPRTLPLNVAAVLLKQRRVPVRRLKNLLVGRIPQPKERRHQARLLPQLQKLKPMPQLRGRKPPLPLLQQPP